MAESIESSERETLARTLRSLRDDYSSEVPAGIVSHDVDEEKKFKVRAGWFTAVVGALQMAIMVGALDGEDAARVQEFIERITYKGDFSSFKASSQDIQDTDAMIALALKALERQSS